MNKDNIYRELKDFNFWYNREEKKLYIQDKKFRSIIVLDKIRALSLIRFSLRFLNSLTMKSRKSK